MSHGHSDSQNQSVSSSIGDYDFPKADWLKELGQAPAKVYAELYRNALRVAARQLENQADYLRELSEAEGPQDVFARHSGFAQKFLAGWIAEGQRLFTLNRESDVTTE
ncbi:phasin family protein [Pseudochelatococcus sp. B33]